MRPICLLSALTTYFEDIIKENCFTLKKARIRRYLAETKADADYVDDIALLAKTPIQAESLLPRLEQTEGDIGFCVKVNKTEYMCFSRGAISPLDSGPLKLVNKFTYLISSDSFTESNINIPLAKACTAIP